MQMPRPKMRHKGHVWGMYVAPEARGQGLGRLILDAIIQRASVLPDLEEIVLAVTVSNDAARAIYIRAGFVPYCVDPRLLKINGRYYDVEWLALRVHEASD
jgi:ribosomal protein S18 acetylase RimI-like enzyme